MSTKKTASPSMALTIGGMRSVHINFEINKHILLTGAGFTKDFGGFLAKEMWSWIFNYPKIKKYPNLSNLLKNENDFDYESIYYKVVESDKFDKNEKHAITNAIRAAYEKLDKKLLAYKHGKHPVSINEVNKFIARFAWNRPQKGFFFTLNQDRFIERYFSSSDYSIVTLGVQKPLITDLTDYDDILLPDSIESMVNKISDAQFFYVKLHGSYKWKSGGGSDRMVIGKNKKGQIEKEPILKYYLDCFKEVLSSGNIKLFVIGYGFGDEHINEIVAEAIKNNNLKLYVLNPVEPDKFKNDLCKDKKKLNGDRIWNGIAGYYPYSLSQVFPEAETVEYKLIQDSYFDFQE